eukprot:jgi/Botrbrau1/21402/Bobra.0216s0021.1
MGLPQRCNKYVYGQDEPLEYNLTTITTPIAVVSGGLDELSDAQDIRTLTTSLPANLSVYVHTESLYQHLDFTWGWEAYRRIYPPLVDLMKLYAQPAINWSDQ